MKRNLAIFLLLAAMMPSMVLADGGMIHFDPFSGRWDYADETNQQAFINYENGVEKMILSVGLAEMKEGKTMWIFPVPAEPKKVSVDVFEKIPHFRGEELSEKAEANLDDSLRSLFASQIYPLPYLLARNILSGSSNFEYSGAKNASSLGAGSYSEPDVVVYEHLEKEGITSEIVTAKTPQGFREYFQEKGLDINEKSVPVLENYIGEDYSFVVSWIEPKGLNLSREEMSELINNSFTSSYNVKNDQIRKEARLFIKKLKDKFPDLAANIEMEGSWRQDTNYTLTDEQADYITQYANSEPIILKVLEKYGNDQKGVFVTFPTEKIYFPLMPTSVYGSKTVPAEIRVIGHVTPDIYDGIKSFTKTEYYWEDDAQLDQSLKTFYNRQSRDIKYTKIEINAPSKFFSDDLWINNTAPAKSYYTSALARHPYILTLGLLIICSVLTGILLGWLMFRDWPILERIRRFGLIGLANFLSILGLIATILAVKTKKDSEDASELIRKSKEKKYYWKRKIALGLIFIDIPFLVISAFAIPFAISEILSAMSSRYRIVSFGDFFPLIFSFVPVILLVVAWFLAQIKSEDQQLFNDLAERGYSTWTFQPKDKRKIAFIFLYSITFLIISWAAVKLLLLSLGKLFI